MLDRQRRRFWGLAFASACALGLLLRLSLAPAGRPVDDKRGWLSGWFEPPAAPAVNYPLIDGQRLRQQDLLGKVVLIHFWATSCSVCVREMPALVALHERLAPRGYAMVAVAMAYDRPDFVLHFARTQVLPFSVALDLNGELARAFAPITGTPSSVLVSAQGQVIRRWEGEPASWGELEQFIESRLPPRS